MNLPSFPVSLTKEMNQLLDRQSDLFDLMAEAHSPVSISLPQSAIDAVLSFRTVLEDRSVTGRIFVAHKATSSPAIIKALRNHTSIDVASEFELTNAITQGFKPDQIVATGPKSRRFLVALAAHEGITISIDSYSELQRLASIAVDGKSIIILLRLTRSVINMPSIHKRSRFGLDAEQLELALNYLEQHPALVLAGVSFHLDSQSIEERHFAVQKAISLLLDIQQRGFTDAAILDIGGGYGSHYGLTSEAYNQFETSLKEMVAGSRPSFTWQDHGYGLSSNGASLRGSISNVELPRQNVGANDLDELLAMKDSNGATVAEQLSENLIELWIEPGGALCSAAGVVIAEVIEIRDCDGDKMIIVDAHRNQICFEGNEHVADPILMVRDRPVKNQAGDAYIAGHLCMENDFMTSRKIAFSQLPRPGDCLMWTHTGAYRSHFSASRSIGHPLSTCYTLTSDNKLIMESV